jgi:hypothetical protein
MAYTGNSSLNIASLTASGVNMAVAANAAADARINVLTNHPLLVYTNNTLRITVAASGATTFAGPLYYPSSAGSSGFIAGTGDGASYTTHNSKWKGHWSTAIVDYSEAVHGLLNHRTGDLQLDGDLTLGAEDIPILDAMFESGAPNMLRNGGFRDGLALWDFTNGGSTSTVAILAANHASALQDGDVTGWAGPTASGGSTALLSLQATASTFYPSISQEIPAEEDRYYSCSALLVKSSVTVSDGARLIVQFLSSAGSALATYTAFGETGSAGPTRDGWGTPVMLHGLLAPTSTRAIKVYIQGKTGYNGANYLYIDQIWCGPGKVARKYTVDPPMPHLVDWT